VTALSFRRWLLLAGVAFVVTLLILAVTNASVPTSAAGQVADTTTISRLQANPAAGAAGLQATATITDTYAAILAVGPLIEPIFSTLFVPVLIR